MDEIDGVCPRCGQDYLENVRLVHLNQDAILCIECDALWVGRDVSLLTFVDYEAYMRDHGRSQPEAPGECELKGRYRRLLS